MKIGVLGTGFGVVHLQIFSNHPLVDEVVFFSRTHQKVDELSAQMGLNGTTKWTYVKSRHLAKWYIRKHIFIIQRLVCDVTCWISSWEWKHMPD